MAEGNIAVKFQSEGADKLAASVALITRQLQGLQNAAKSVNGAVANVGAGAGVAGTVGFSAETWSKLHAALAGIEDESIRVRQAIEALGASMKRAGAGGASANTAAIKAQTAAMKDLANTNAMLHEVLIGEAPLNVKIAATRKQITVATQAQTAATQANTVATKANAAGAYQLSRAFSGISSVMMFISPELATIAMAAQACGTAVRGVAGAFRLAGIAGGVAGAALVGTGVAITAVVVKAYSDLKKAIEEAVSAYQKTADMAVSSTNKEIQATERLYQWRKKLADAHGVSGVQNVSNSLSERVGQLNRENALLEEGASKIREQLKALHFDVEQWKKDGGVFGAITDYFSGGTDKMKEAGEALAQRLQGLTSRIADNRRELADLESVASGVAGAFARVASAEKEAYEAKAWKASADAYNAVNAYNPLEGLPLEEQLARVKSEIEGIQWQLSEAAQGRLEGLDLDGELKDLNALLSTEKKITAEIEKQAQAREKAFREKYAFTAGDFGGYAGGLSSVGGYMSSAQAPSATLWQNAIVANTRLSNSYLRQIAQNTRSQSAIYAD